MKKTAIVTSPTYYQGYIDQAPDVELLDTLPKGGLELYLNDQKLLNEIGLQTYAEGKWTVNQIVEHLIDTERIFVNRALRFARKDSTELPGYEENDYAETARSNERTLDDLLEEYKAVRASSNFFFQHLNEEQLLAEGVASNQRISVLAIGFILVGHPIHHFGVIQERYAPLVG